MLPSISSRRRCLPTENGDADRLTIACAPARDQLLDRIVVIAAAFPEVAIVPDVFADADAEPPAAEIEDLRPVERLEVAVLVEDVVGRAAAPCESAARPAVAQQHRAVEERPPFVGRVRLGQSDQHRRQRRRARAPARASAAQLRATKAALSSRSRGR